MSPLEPSLPIFTGLKLKTLPSPREIQRRRAKRIGIPLNLMKAESGVTLKEMSIVTFFMPLKMLATEPLVILLSLYVGFIFAVTFQFFISIPVVLETTYNFTVYVSATRLSRTHPNANLPQTTGRHRLQRRYCWGSSIRRHVHSCRPQRSPLVYEESRRYSPGRVQNAASNDWGPLCYNRFILDCLDCEADGPLP